MQSVVDGKKRLNRLERSQMRTLENWIENNVERIVKERMTRERVALVVSEELGIEKLTECNIESAAKTVNVKIPRVLRTGRRGKKSACTKEIAALLVAMAVDLGYRHLVPESLLILARKKQAEDSSKSNHEDR